MSSYVKSKLIAERAAWDFIRRESGGREFAVINPAGIFGPVLGPDTSSSTEMVRRLPEGNAGVPAHQPRHCRHSCQASYLEA
jgi:nucleoside-diphosphate-sugar epimerase